METEKIKTVEEKSDPVERSVPRGVKIEKTFDKEAWTPKTSLGKKVKAGQITSIDQILDNGIIILESEIVDVLLPHVEIDLLAIGQSKGKFGGGKRTIWRQVQKKTAEGNKPHFAALAVVGNKDGYIGIGYGKARETVPAREKAIRNAKLNVIKIRRGSGSWESLVPASNSIPFAVEGRCGSVRVRLMPAPKGTGLVVEKTCRRIIELAGIKDVYSKTFGHTKTKLNAVKAFFEALKQLSRMRVQPEQYKQLGIVEGNMKREEVDVTHG